MRLIAAIRYVVCVCVYMCCPFIADQVYASTPLPPNCTQTYSSNASIPIPSSNTSTINSAINIPLSQTIVDVNLVNLDIDHSYIQDLEVILISPAGTEIKLIDNICNSQDNIKCSLDDEASNTLPCPPAGNNTYRPGNFLSSFDGQNTNGTWTLRVNDTYPADGGNLNGWGLEFTFECVEICNDGIDNDGDGDTDCDDSDCSNGLNLHRWLNIPGTSISSLTSNSNYPNSPTEIEKITSFQGPNGYGEEYGTRVFGYIKPTQSGAYTFNITGDDDIQLKLSTDANPNNATIIGSQVGWSNPTDHNKFPSQTSSVINLTAGNYYYVEFLHKESNGGDHFNVYWKTPSNSNWVIIPNSNLVPTDCYEICNDGIDNDGDGLIDCNDPDSDCYPVSLTPSYNINNQGWTNGNSLTACDGDNIQLAVQSGIQSNITLTYPNGTVDNTPNGNSYFNISTSQGSGNYTITYTNSHNCSSQTVFAIQVSEVTINSVTESDPSNCPHLNNGSISISASGSNLEYSINNGASYNSSNVFNNLQDGSYQIKVRNSITLCEESYSSTVVLTDPSCVDPCTDTNGDGNIDCNDTGCMPIIQSVSSSNPSNCPQANNGSISITAEGLNLLYSINGVNYQANNTFNNLSAGSYTITVRNTISNCTATYSSNPVILTAPDCSEICNNNYDDDGDGLIDCLDPDCGAPSISNVSSSNNTDCTTANGNISINATGNNLNYSITGGAPYSSSSVFNGLDAGVYTISVINTATNCTANYGNISLTGPICAEICNNGVDDDGDGDIDCADSDCSQLVINSISANSPLNCPDQNNGSIVINASGNNLQYSINNGLSFQSSNTFTNLVAGNYNISIKNSVTTCTLNATSTTTLTNPNCTPSSCGNVSYTDCDGNAGSGYLTSNQTYILKAGDINNREFCLGDVTPNCTITNKRVAYCMEYGVLEGSQNDHFVQTRYDDPYIRWGDYGTTVERRRLMACRIQWITCNYPYSLEAHSAVWKVTKPNLGGLSPTATAIYNAAVAAVPTANGTELDIEVYRKEPYTNSRQDLLIWDCQTPCNVTASATGTTSICQGQSAQLNGSASGGSGPYTYQWMQGSTILGSSSSISVSPTSNTNYILNVTDNAGCTASSNISVSIDPMPNASAAATGGSCSSNNGMIQFTFADNAAKSTISFSINNGSTYPVTVADYSGTYTWSGLSTGSYEVWCRWGDGGCPTPLGTVAVVANGSPNAAIEGLSQICLGSDVSINVTTNSGTPPYTYAWNNGLSNNISHTVTPTTTTNYIVTVTDVNGCTTVASKSIEVNSPPALSLSTTTPCYVENASINSVCTGGTTPYTYLTTGPNGFMANTSSFTISEAGSYTMTVTDANGCTASDVIDIHPELSTSISAPNSPVCQSTNTTMEVSPAGMTYSWSTGATSQSIDIVPLQSQWYYVTTTDANGCNSVDSSYLEVNSVSLSSVSHGSNLDCDGNCTGSFDIVVAGSTNTSFNLSYTYQGNTVSSGPHSISTPGTDETFTINNLCSGVYSNITISSIDGLCSYIWSTNVSITESNADWEHVNHTSNVSNCSGACDGSFTVDANLGVTGDYNVSFDLNGVTSTIGPFDHAGDLVINNLCPGVYSNITITSVESGCQDVWPNDIVIEEPSPDVNLVSVVNDNCQLSEGSATVNISGGSYPYAVNWTSTDGMHTGTDTITFHGNITIDGLIGGKTYCFDIVDDNGCAGDNAND